MHAHLYSYVYHHINTHTHVHMHTHTHTLTPSIVITRITIPFIKNPDTMQKSQDLTKTLG